jgi:hypothetical protein
MKWHETSDIARLYVSNFEDEMFFTDYGYKFMFKSISEDMIRITGWKNDICFVDYNLSKSLLLLSFDPKAILNFILNDMMLKLDETLWDHIR